METDGDEAEFLTEVDSWLRDICTQANQLDRDPEALQQAFWTLGKRSLLGLKGPTDWGGTDWGRTDLGGTDLGGTERSPLLFYHYQETVARYSGALAFLQTQHQSAVGMLSSCHNPSLKDQYLRHAIQGTIGIGVGFSQLRRSGSPLVTAVPIAAPGDTEFKEEVNGDTPSETQVEYSNGGFWVNGQVPWITGYGCFQQFILGATLPDGRILFGLLPLETTVQSHQGSSTKGHLTISKPLDLAAMMATNTVTATLKNWHLPANQVLTIKAADWIHQSDRRKTLNHSFFALGCARAGLDIMAIAANQSNDSAAIQDTLKATWSRLDTQLTHCRQKIYHAQSDLHSTPGDGGDQAVAHRLQFRAEAIHLAVRCAHGAVIVSKGAANILDHPAQRVYREALAFSVFGQTTAVMQASLSELVR